MDFLTKRDPTAPFFLNISFIDPHPPLTPPAPYYERYIRRDSPAPAVGDWAAGFDAPQKGLHPDAWEIRLPAEELHCARAPRNWGWPTEQVCQTPVGLQDIMPSLLEAAGLDAPATYCP